MFHNLLNHSPMHGCLSDTVIYVVLLFLYNRLLKVRFKGVYLDKEIGYFQGKYELRKIIQAVETSKSPEIMKDLSKVYKG